MASTDGSLSLASTTTASVSDVEDFRAIINPHWLTYPKPTFAVNATLGFVLLLAGIVSVCGNVAVLYVFSKIVVTELLFVLTVIDFLHSSFATTRRLRVPSSALIINLALSDLGMMLVTCPMFFVSSIRERWIFGENACRFYGFGGAFFGTASIVTMAGIALDKYMAICKPFLTVGSAGPATRVKLIIPFVWLYSAAWAIPPVFGVGNYVLEGFLTTCTFDYLDTSIASRSFILAMCVGAYAAPLCVIGITYSCINWKVRVYSQRCHEELVIGRNKKNEETVMSPEMKRQVRTAKIALTVVAGWTIAWTPYAVVSLLGVASYTHLLTPMVAMLPAVFAKCAAAYNPIIYVFRYTRYRIALRRIVMGWIGGPDLDAGETSVSQTQSRSHRLQNGLARSNARILKNRPYFTSESSASSLSVGTRLHFQKGGNCKKRLVVYEL